jgi:hypothetical protein
MAASLELPSELEILTDVIVPDSPDLPRESAEWLLSLKFSDKQQSRIAQLLEKGNRGELLPAEHEALDRFRRIGMMLNLLRAKAELSLAQDSPGP